MPQHNAPPPNSLLAPSPPRNPPPKVKPRGYGTPIDGYTQSEAPAATLEATRLRAEAAKTAYEGMFTQAERFQAMFNTRSDYVAIQERASPAMEAVVDWKMPMITAGGAGAAAGLIAGLIISFVISMLGRSNEPQQAAS